MVLKLVCIIVSINGYGYGGVMGVGCGFDDNGNDDADGDYYDDDAGDDYDHHCDHDYYDGTPNFVGN